MIRPMLAELVEKPFDRPGWIFEIKWDGYRAIAEIQNGSVTLSSRNGKDFTKRYAPIAEALGRITHDCILDGEIIALKNGRPDFHTLQEYDLVRAPLQYAVFDILELDGKDVRAAPLRKRKALLKKVLVPDEALLWSEYVEERGIEFFREMERGGFEGMVAKNVESPYREGTRSSDWQKVKAHQVQEAIIVGFTRPKGARKYFGSLLLAVHENGALRYAGHSGGSFTDTELEKLHEVLSKSTIRRAPVKNVEHLADVTWVEPRIVSEIRFTEWTPDGLMRHPVYLGLRDDKDAAHVVREEATPLAPDSRTAVLTNLDKVYFPDDGYTKGDVIDYYDRLAETMLPYLRDRPENLHRHPNGIAEKSFFHKNMTGPLPAFVETTSVWSESNAEAYRYLVCNNRETLLYLANLGCIEINPWNSRVGTLDRPDYFVLDLDPHGRPMEDVVLVALAAKKILDLACETHCIKTSGKTGLHIFVPLGARYRYEEAKSFAELLMHLIHREVPHLTSLERSPEKRKGLIYLDYLQNRFGQTLAAPYSIRPFPGGRVSAPLEWAEVQPGLDPGRFTLKTMEARLREKGDLWKPILGKGVDLRDALRCLEEHTSRTGSPSA